MLYEKNIKILNSKVRITRKYVFKHRTTRNMEK